MGLADLSEKRIVQLDPLVANQIAAGEVVERPASVVKEMLENSIDAGASQIDVEIEGGGIHLIRVRDNGVGIVKSDLALAFSRHATSKIATTHDLAAILSLGFRGEALASIASISRCRLTSRARGAQSAWQVEMGMDLTPQIHPAAHPQGTTVEVSDLFYNTPVRRKFLRSEKTEFLAIDEVFKRIALGYPEIGFSLKAQQRLIRCYPAQAVGSHSRISKICGQSFIEQALIISMQATGLSLEGSLGLPDLANRQADCQYFFVNRRMVKDKILSHAIKSLYQQHPLYVEGTYPAFVLYLTVDPGDVDVNVHPTKQEVRFSQPRLVHDFITKCVANALATTSLSPAKAVSVPIKQGEPAAAFDFEREKDNENKNESESENESENKNESEELNHVASFHVSKRYALLEDEAGVTLIDLEQAKNALLTFYFDQHWGKIKIKKLLFPASIHLKQSVSIERLHDLQALGFYVRTENKRQLFVLEQPVFSIAKNVSLEAVLIALLQNKENKEKDKENKEKDKENKEKEKENKEKLCQTLAEQLDLDCVSLLLQEEGETLLREWITRTNKGPWVRFSHERIKAIINSQ
ncbi:MAG: DNA mismatch repair endonuclease MutL [Candidatus Berkiellales bacterium]